MRGCLGTLLRLAAAGAVAMAPAGAAPYSIVDLGALPSADASTTAAAVNNVGQAAGYSGHPFLYSGGALTDLRPSLPASVFAPAPARALNDAGVVVGSFLVGAVRHPFRWSGGTFTDLNPAATSSEEAVAVNSAGDIALAGPVGSIRRADGTRIAIPGFTPSAAFTPADMNDALTVVGRSVTAEYADHAALWRDGTTTDLGALPGDANSVATGLNAGGWVVGASYGPSATAANIHPFVYHDGALAALPPRIAGESCVPTAINRFGRIVGYVGGLAAGGEQRALLWEDGTVADIQALIPADSGWTLLAARDISDSGQIVGYGLHSGSYRAFILTPAPVPGDANGDLRLTPQDAALALSMAIGATPATGVDRLDVAPTPSPAPLGYGDGRIDVLDALRILRRASALEPVWP